MIILGFGHQLCIVKVNAELLQNNQVQAVVDEVFRSFTQVKVATKLN